MASTSLAKKEGRVDAAVRILGISCFYHDSAVACLEDGQVRFAIQEERLSRQKHDARFPVMAVAKALEVCESRINDIDHIVYYEDPRLKLTRLFDQAVGDWPRSWQFFSERVPQYYHFKYPVQCIISDILRFKGKITINEHHRSHAASSFLTSPFERALIVSIDGVGEHESTATWLGEGNELKKLAAVHFPDSLGLLYSVFTQYLGFRVNNGEYKVMGLAPYGEPKYVQRILKEILWLHEDGSYCLNKNFFTFCNIDRHYHKRLEMLLDGPGRKSQEPVTDRHRDIAASIQRALELAVLNILRSLQAKYQIDDICMAGGVALNCTCNAHMIRDLGVRLHVHPAASDAGGALGAALGIAADQDKSGFYRASFQPYLGVAYSEKFIKTTLDLNEVPYRYTDQIEKEAADALSAGKVVALIHGRDEWGPRALGNRSILADPRKAEMKDHLNAKIKFREEFRPFAPVVMEEHFGEYFETLGMASSPYMLFTHKVRKPDVIPAVVHVDNTSRVQTVSEAQNPRLYRILKEFYKLTGVPVLINTSFNLRGEPMVSNPSDALNTFFRSDMDILMIENFWVEKPF